MMDFGLIIANGIWEAVSTSGHIGMELEFRLGHVLPGGHFSPNVGKQPFLNLKAALDRSSAFDRIVDVETVEKVGDTVKHVTTLSFSDAGEPNPPPPCYCMTKTKAFQRDAAESSVPYVVRCSVSFEHIVPLQQVPSRLTRHKRRRRYVFKCWAFDLTEVVSNTDIDTEESYEVEIELLDPGMLFERTMDSLAEWGLALVADAMALTASKA